MKTTRSGSNEKNDFIMDPDRDVVPLAMRAPNNTCITRAFRPDPDPVNAGVNTSIVGALNAARSLFANLLHASAGVVNMMKEQSPEVLS